MLHAMDSPADHAETIVGGQTGYAVPLVVAVTGHRDLVPAEVPEIRARVRAFLRRLVVRYPERPVTVMSSLAEGADQLVAEEALAQGISVIAPLPMPRRIYLDDFETPAAREKFNLLLARATEFFELPILPGSTAESITEDAEARSRQYAQLGVFLCAHCHILLALWDGKYTDDLGGTAQVVRFHHDDVMPGYTPQATVNRQILAEDESDLVYHIVCSRDRPDGQPAAGMQPGSCSWFTSDETEPRTERMPERHRKVLQLTREFSRDAVRHEASIVSEGWPLFDDSSVAVLPAGARDINHVFRAADWLAIRYQKRHLLVLRATHLLAMLMGVAYIIYSDLLPQRVLILAFVAFFVLAAAIHRLGNRHGWHRKYLDYRTLAEGLRVQFYWAVAGVTSGNRTKYSHDNFLQMQDAELGWIRNVMRVAGIECDVKPNRDPAGVAFSIREWIGDENSGQLGYYGRKAREKIGRNRRTQRFAAVFGWVSVVALALFFFSPDEFADLIRDPIVVLMGMLLLAIGIRQSYSFSIADFELIKQYEFMYRAFGKAHDRIGKCATDDDRRGVLRLLGQAALDEHAEWILMHRERAISEGEIWRMTG
jgi:hypothetical protein